MPLIAADDAPSIDSQPLSLTNLVGSSAIFSVAASGTPTLTYQWFFDGSALDGATESSFQITSVQPASAGNYQVIITNVAGSITSSVATLTVWFPPAILAHPQDQIEKSGSAATFTVQATGSGPLAYQWQLDGKNLLDNDRVSGVFSPQLLIRSIRPADLGEYRVMVTNIAGSVTSTVARLRASVTIADSGLARALALALGKSSESTTFASDELSSLSSLSASFAGITNLSGLEWGTSLAKLDVCANTIANVDPLAGIFGLKELDLHQNNIHSVEPISALTQLTFLNLGDNILTNAQPLSGLTNLYTLLLYDNRLSDLGFLQSLSTLASLTLDRNSLTNLAPVTNVRTLRTLSLGGNPALDFGPLQLLSNLTSLSLGSSSLSNLDTVPSLEALEYLDLEYNDLRDLSALSRFPSLASLSLSGNPSLIPSTLPALTNLSTLLLAATSLTNLDFAPRLPSLNTLTLDNNNLTDAGPLTLLTNLSHLSLEANQISNGLPLAALTNLSSLNLTRNQLRDLSFLVPLTNSPGLTLLLARNFISDLAPLTMLTNLSRLDLGENRLSDIGTLANLGALSWVNLVRNCLDVASGTPTATILATLTNHGCFVLSSPQRLPPQICPAPGCPGMLASRSQWYLATNASLLLDFNVLDGVPPGNHLYVVAMADNQQLLPPASLAISGSNNTRTLTVQPASSQTGSSTITVYVTNEVGLVASYNFTLNVLTPLPVSIHDAGLSAAIHDALRLPNGLALSNIDLLNLDALSAASRQISDLRGLEFATNLSRLDLGGNSILTLDSLRDLRNLESLSIPHNPVLSLAQITNLANLGFLDVRWTSWNQPDYEVLAPLHQLTDLYLGGNGLTNGAFLTNFFALTFLDLDQNAYEDVSPVLTLKNLTGLDLSYNQWTNLPVIAALQGLTNLYLSGNRLSNLEFISGFTSLNALTLYSNVVQDISPLAQLTNLVTLNVARSPVTNYAVLSQFAVLEYLFLTGNGISNAEFLIDCSSLKGLHLNENTINDLSPIAGLVKLEQLDLEANPITVCTNLLSLTNLSQLNLGGAPSLDLGSIPPLPRLRTVSLRTNLLSSASALAHLYTLESLDLSWNYLENSGSVPGLTNLQHLSLSCNRLTNIDHLLAFPLLRSVDLRWNKLNTSVDSDARAVAARLQAGGTDVILEPQNSSPAALFSDCRESVLDLSRWYVAVDGSGFLTISIYDDITPLSLCVLRAVSSNPALLPNGNIALVRTNNGVRLSINPLAGQRGSTTITLTVEDFTGLVQQYQISLFVVPAQTVNFPDPHLENSVRTVLGIPAGDISNIDVLGMTRLWGDGGITNLSGLEWGTNLLAAFLSGNSIGDLSPLRELKELTWLDLKYNSVEDPEPLNTLANLFYLDLSWNPITNHTELGRLEGLNTLLLDRANFQEAAFLTNLPQLRFLSIADNKLTDVEPLASLTNLLSLTLRQNRLANVAPLTNLTQLQSLDVTLNIVPTNCLSVLGLLTNCHLFTSPQRAPPSIDIRTNWIVSSGATSSIPFLVLDSGPVDEQLQMSVRSDSDQFIPGLEATVVRSDARPWMLWLTNTSTLSSTAELTLRATNDVGLECATTVFVLATNLGAVDANLLEVAGLMWTNSGAAPWFGQYFFSWTNGAAQSGPVGYGQSSLLQTGVKGPGTVSFYWKVSSQTNSDFLEFAIPGHSIRISGEVGWQERSVSVPDGWQTLSWRFYKDGYGSGGLDAGWVDHVQFTPGFSVPDILGGPESRTINLGADAFFAVSARGGEPLRYQWYHNATNLLPGQTSPALSIPVITEASAGEYSVLVLSTFSDEHYALSSNALLTVNHLPVPSSPPLNRTRFYGVKVRSSQLRGVDYDGDPVTLDSVTGETSEGGTTVLTNGWIFYNPAVGAQVADSFEFTISDGRGGSATGQAEVNVIAPSGLLLIAQRLPEGDMLLAFDAVPNRLYYLQVTTNMLTAPWETFGVTATDLQGCARFQFRPPSNAFPQFYRAIEP